MGRTVHLKSQTMLDYILLVLKWWRIWNILSFVDGSFEAALRCRTNNLPTWLQSISSWKKKWSSQETSCWEEALLLPMVPSTGQELPQKFMFRLEKTCQRPRGLKLRLKTFCNPGVPEWCDQELDWNTRWGNEKEEEPSDKDEKKKEREMEESHNLTKTLHVLKSGSVKILKHKTVPY